MDNIRTVAATKIEFFDARRKFSSFRFIEQRFDRQHSPRGGFLSLRRLFSQARNHGYKGFIVEHIPEAGAVRAEVTELRGSRLPGYELRGLLRVSFWRTPVRDVAALQNTDAIGYAILKHDHLPGSKVDWHVFESVLLKDPYRHSYVPCERTFTFGVGLPGNVREFRLPGVLFCEQNGLNKSCAQVAIRSLCAATTGDGPSFTEINDLARTARYERRLPGSDIYGGLYEPEIVAVIKGLGFGLDHLIYHQEPRKRKTHPYQRYLYSGLESGAGALLGFSKSRDPQGGKHILPVFGHTFNKNALVPRSEQAYFHVGRGFEYIPSDSWLSSFIGHDDRFGSNFCLPRFYIDPRHVNYAASLIPPRMQFTGLRAEVMAFGILQEMLDVLPRDWFGGTWNQRLLAYAAEKQLVLRPVPISGARYLQHLQELRDWEYRSEAPEALEMMATRLTAKDLYWMVEISLPELFPTNLRKLGEILLHATRADPADLDFSHVANVRLLDQYIESEETVDPKGKWTNVLFTSYPSRLRSHTPILCPEVPGKLAESQP